MIFFRFANAQPQPCGPNPAMTPTCMEACVICDIDGYTGINDNPATGVAPPGFCTNTVHHVQWIAFIAGSTNLTIELQVFNCQNTGTFNGLEVGIYESLDCQTFNLVSNCEGDVNNGTTGVFTTTQPLTIGQYYYWVMDGNNNDICNYTIHVVEGTTLVPPLSPAGSVTGETAPCPGQPYFYAVPPITGANFYEWTIDGQPAGGGTTVEITWTEPGVHELCVTAFNVCDTVMPSCLLVDVLPPIETLIEGEICDGDCFEVADTLLCDAGNYEFQFASWQGCDSTVTVNLATTPVVTGNLSADICDTDSIEVAGQFFYPPGQFQAVATSWLGCDSVINLTLGAIICEIEGAFDATPIFCHGDQSGEIIFSVTSGTPPFTYTWKELNGAPSGSGSLAGVDQDETIGNLPPGMYLITVNDNFGNDVVLVVPVTEAAELAIDWADSNFNNLNISCFGESDGSLEALVSGGTPPYLFAWSNGETTALLQNLAAGTYEITVTDAAGCKLVSQNTLTQPSELMLLAQFNDPTCEGFNTGSILASSATGGVGPYLFSLADGAFGPGQAFENLPGGSYALTVQDANGCTAGVSGDLIAPAIPVVDAGDDVTIKLAERTRLTVSSTVFPASVSWAQQPGLSCYDCLNPEASPFETTTYTVTVTSADGCTATDSVTVNILKIREFYVPNAFSPNGDGINDALTVFGGAAVSEVRRFLIFDRWGELVFEGKNFPPNDLSAGWDGTFKGDEMQPAVFAWFAEVEFIDGEAVLAEGDVNLLR